MPPMTVGPTSLAQGTKERATPQAASSFSEPVKSAFSAVAMDGND